MHASFGSIEPGTRVLVTGHTGFKGAWLCALLVRAGATVTGLALAPEGDRNLWRDAGLERDVESHLVDLRDADATAAAVAAAKADVVFHLAAQAIVRRGYREPVLTYATNVMGTVHLLEAIRHAPGPRAVVVVTSDKVYADEPHAGGYAEDARLGGADPYAGSKAAAELAVETYRQAYFSGGRGPAVATARAGNVIGGGDFSDDRLLPDIVRARAAGQAVVIRRPDAIRPWQHVLDPLAGYLRLAEALTLEPERFAGAWNFGPSEAIAVRDVIGWFDAAWPAPGPSWTIDGGGGEHETHRLEIDASKSRAALGWEARWKTRDAVVRSALWYRDRLAGAAARTLVERDLDAYAAGATAAAG